MNAIRNRQTFATSGAKMALGFRADGELMGARLSGPPRCLEIAWSAEGPLELCVFSPDASGATHAIYKGEPTPVITLGGLSPKGFAYVRLTQTSTGETAWASPVFW